MLIMYEQDAGDRKTKGESLSDLKDLTVEWESEKTKL